MQWKWLQIPLLVHNEFENNDKLFADVVAFWLFRQENIPKMEC